MATPAELAALKTETKKELWLSRKSAHEEYDRALLTLASGGLALSVTLIKDMFPLDTVVKSEWLLASWVLFAAAILAVIISFLLSQYVHNAVLKGLESSTPPPPPPIIVSNIIVCLNWLAGATFVAGVFAMISFSATNFTTRLTIAQEKEKKNKISGNSTDAAAHGVVRATCACCAGTSLNTTRGTTTAANSSAKSSTGEQSKPVAPVTTGAEGK